MLSILPQDVRRSEATIKHLNAGLVMQLDIVKRKADLVIDIQGDEPLVTPAMLKLSIDTLLEDDSLSCVNLFRYISYDEAKDKNESKIVTNPDGIALYYSRETIPTTWLGEKEIKTLPGVSSPSNH